MALRQRLNAGAADGARISVNDLIVKAVARALVSFPVLNATFAGDTLTLHQEIAVCVAVALDDGLVTPVVHHAEHKTLRQIAREDTRIGRASARGERSCGRLCGWDVHGKQSRHVQGGHLCRDHQSTAGRHPGGRRGTTPPCVCRRRTAAPPTDVDDTFRGPSDNATAPSPRASSRAYARRSKQPILLLE